MYSRKSNKGQRVAVIMVGDFDTERRDRCRRLLGYIFPRGGEGVFAGKEFLRSGNAKCLGFFTIDDTTKN